MGCGRQQAVQCKLQAGPIIGIGLPILSCKRTALLQGAQAKLSREKPLILLELRCRSIIVLVFRR